MTKLHPVHALKAKLQTAQLNAIETLAAKDMAISADALRELATIQTALTALREEVESHAIKLGWGAGEAGSD